MKRSITFLLLLSMFVSLFSGMAFAADSNQTAETSDSKQVSAAVNDTPFSDVKSVFNAQFYVNACDTAALPSSVSVLFDKLGTSGTLYLPGKTDAAQLCFSWNDAGLTVSADGTQYESGSAPVAPAGSSVTYKVTKGLAVAYVTIKTVQGSAGVEPMFLELDEALGTIDAMNSDEKHDTSCYGNVLFDDSSNYVSIKGRGNSTWKAEKKPYNITLYKKADYDKKLKVEFVPGVKANKWSLIANHLDNSLMRNKIAMDLADALGIGLTTRFVDLWMNGEYLGSYLMTPKNDYAKPDGGYVLENDNYLDDEDPQFQIPGMYEIGAPIKDDGYYNRMTIKEIGDAAADAGADAAAIEAYFTEAWAAVEDFDSENYQNYFDMDSWAKMFLMYEVSKTYDCFAGSLLMHRDGLTPDDKLIAGPAWDYDVSFGRTLHKFLVGMTEPLQLNAEGWYNDSIGLLAVDKPISMLQELGKHASFMQHVAKIYNEYKSVFEDIPANVTRQQEVLRGSALMNNVLWGTHHLCAEYLIAPTTMSLIGTGQYRLNYRVTLDWDAYVYNLREFAAKRVMWLSDHLYQAETPVGAIEALGSESDGTLRLQAALTAGAQNATYQWQRSENGTDWTDIPDATAAQLAPETGDALYRCVVSNAGAVICTTHGGKVPTFTQTILDPVTVGTLPEPVEPPVIDPAAYADIACSGYTYLGDSISWGYGLDPNTDNHDPFNVGRRVKGSFTDLVATVLEQNNPGMAVHPAASSGARLCDFRVLLDRGMGVESPYERTNDWYGNRHPERTERLLEMGPDIVEWLRASDVITVQVGINDLTAALVNALYATGLVDINKLGEISDFNSALDYVRFALGNLAQDPNVLGNLTQTFNDEIQGIRENAVAVMDAVEKLAPANAKILLIGYHKAVQDLRVIPGTDFSPIFDLADSALVSLNDYFASVADRYDNVFYVDAPDADIFYDDGTSLVDILKNVSGFLYGVHPDAEGHVYIAQRVLDALESVGKCAHTHTEFLRQTVKLPFGYALVSAEVCSDCGEVVHEAKVTTPTGTLYLPMLTIRNTADTFRNAVSAAIGRITGGLLGRP